MFTDDLVIVPTDKDRLQARSTLKADLLTVTEYFKKLKLSFNVSKTQIMNFCKFWRKDKMVKFPDIEISDGDIEQVETFMYSGVRRYSGDLVKRAQNRCLKILLRKDRLYDSLITQGY